MKSSLASITPTVVKHTRDECWSCGYGIIAREDGFFEYFHPVTSRGRTTITAQQICRDCYLIECAFKEAEADGVRYSGIIPFRDGQRWSGNHGTGCPCGNVGLEVLGGWCITCSREQRMLDKKMADARFNRRLINQLKEALKNGKDQDNG